MPRILHFTKSPNDWKALLADPDKHWRGGHSAKTLAHAWEAADGFPQEVGCAFVGSSNPLMQSIKPILAIPEFKVALPGGERASQNDLFVLANCNEGAVTIMVEGKVSESFGPTVGEWLEGASEGKKERLRFLLGKLELSEISPSTRYQLLHRTVSAIVEAERFRAVAAVILVHSFSDEQAGYADYEAFVGLFKTRPQLDQVTSLGLVSGTQLFAGWVRGDTRFKES